MDIILYYHPDTWRVKSVFTTSDKDVLQKRAFELGKQGYHVLAIANTDNPISMLDLGYRIGENNSHLLEQIKEELKYV